MCETRIETRTICCTELKSQVLHKNKEMLNKVPNLWLEFNLTTSLMLQSKIRIKIETCLKHISVFLST
jgi:hypothetical protein